MKRTHSILGFALVAGVAAQANATVINDPNNGEPTLQEIMNGFTVNGDSSVNADTDQVRGDSYWSTQAQGGSIANLVVEYTANEGDQSLGIYDRSNINNTVTFFDSNATAGTKSYLNFDGNGGITALNVTDSDPNNWSVVSQSTFSSSSFGFFLDLNPNNNGDRYYSDRNLNNGNEDRFVAYQGQGEMIDIGYGTREWGTATYLFGAEDHTDGDFQDAVFMVESISPVPEPGTLSLLGLGIAGLGFSASRRRKTA